MVQKEISKNNTVRATRYQATTATQLRDDLREYTKTIPTTDPWNMSGAIPCPPLSDHNAGTEGRVVRQSDPLRAVSLADQKDQMSAGTAGEWVRGGEMRPEAGGRGRGGSGGSPVHNEPSMDIIEPFRSRSLHLHHDDVRPGGNLNRILDPTAHREDLVRGAPLERTEQMKLGEYSPTQWRDTRDTRCRKAQELLEESDRLRGKSRESESRTQDRTNTAQNEVTKALDLRLADTLALRTRLEEAIRLTIDELNAENDMKTRLQLALFALELPERNNGECLHIRTLRQEIDITRDPTTHALEKERDTLLTGRRFLTTCLKETRDEIERLREVKRLLEQDWSEKQEAFQLDHFAAKLDNASVMAQYKPVSAALHEGSSTPHLWLKRTEDHLQLCLRERTAGSHCRANCDQALKEVSRDVRSAGDDVDVALNRRLSELEDAKARLKEQDKRLMGEVAQQELSIRSLRQSLHDKEAPHKVSQTRHWTRSFRPGYDRCLDPPHYRLMEELDEIPRSIEELRERLRASENTLEDLHRRHEDMTKAILNHDHTLSLEQRCVTVRSHGTTMAKLQGLEAW
ncbi:tektin-4-like [Oratosquilla oratoria]|uniref:tektin-4-like n=1 Tax=Oratosquilla oratoria TaxID=337810 RepID=UPI003F76F112